MNATTALFMVPLPVVVLLAWIGPRIHTEKDAGKDLEPNLISFESL